MGQGSQGINQIKHDHNFGDMEIVSSFDAVLTQKNAEAKSMSMMFGVTQKRDRPFGKNTHRLRQEQKEGLYK